MGKLFLETPSQKIPSQNKADGVAQGEGPEFKPQYCKNKNKTKQNKKPKMSGK
jgi:hypothetical protein